MTRPLVLLDVDGVINDLHSLHFGNSFGLGTDIKKVRAGRYTVHIPTYMPDLVQALDANCEVHWLTTWREGANGAITKALGIDRLPVVTDGTRIRTTGWKAGAAYDLAERALQSGREVWWIEDFYGRVPREDMPFGVKFVDTARVEEYPVLRKEMIPPHLLGE